ncbi:hypothetical protein ACIQ4I_12355 [Rummeliibacillus sp. NPDC094406]|uniref:hypothetical protein n=1 Tax=Rummeliibacillus sp. NPDC094406 TaxID=3364511 RepID=UPI0038159373
MKLDEISFVQEEIAAINRTLDMSSEVLHKPLNELGFKILKELNNHDPGTGFKYYSREKGSSFQKYPNVRVADIQEQLGISKDELINEFRVLLIKRYVDFNLPLTEKRRDMLNLMPKMESDTLKYGSIIENIFEEIYYITLTERGFLAMMDYSIKEMQLLKAVLEELNVRNNKQLDELKRVDTERVEAIQILDKKMKSTDNAISNFNKNIFTIFSIMLAIFAVIGINVASIPKIDSNFVFNIIVVNFSICFSLVVLFYLMNTLIYKEKNNALLILLVIFSITFISLGLTKLI